VGGEERSDSVGIFIAEKWVDSVVRVKRHSIRELILKMVLDSGLLNVQTVVRTVCGNSNGFKVKVGMHQGSALSPLLFVIVMGALSTKFRVALPDDLVVIAKTENDLITRKLCYRKDDRAMRRQK